MNEQLPILEQRRIEAAVIKPIYDEMAASLGREQAQQILGDAIKKAAIAQGRGFAEQQGETGLEQFIALFELWKIGGALEVEVLEQAPDRFHFNITRCKYAEMYREMGLGEIGHLLSCNRDGTFCEGYDARITLERSQTIMGGATHCDFRYRFDADAGG